MLQRLDLGDRVAVGEARLLRVEGFADDTIVAAALARLAEATGAEPRWRARIWKRIPVAAGLGGGSSDAATALRLANATLESPLPPDELRALAAEIGADAPFFLEHGPQLGTGDGSELAPLALPQDFWVVLVLPSGETKASTADVYRRFDERAGERGYGARRSALLDGIGAVRRARDLSALPANDLGSSPLADELRAAGAFRADVSGAGPVVYGLFARRPQAAVARRLLRPFGRTWLTAPAWYG